MNPHLRHAQFIPGKNTGGAVGVVDLSVRFPLLLDRLTLTHALQPKLLPSDVIESLREWCHAFYLWLHDSEIRRVLDESANNIGVFYDRLLAHLALSLGEPDAAKERLSNAYDRRVLRQVEADGSMPHELRRTRSLGYSLLNLGGLTGLARLGERVEVPLWSRGESDGRSIGNAARYVYEKLCSGQPWPYRQIVPVEPLGVLSAFRLASQFSPSFDLKALPNIDGPRDADAVLLVSPLHPFR